MLTIQDLFSWLSDLPRVGEEALIESIQAPTLAPSNLFTRFLWGRPQNPLSTAMDCGTVALGKTVEFEMDAVTAINVLITS